MCVLTEHHTLIGNVKLSPMNSEKCPPFNIYLLQHIFYFIAHCRLYKTGDYARIVKGVLQYEGRTDSQVKVRGHRVDLAEVEKTVAATPYVEKAVCLCYKPGEIDQALVAFVTLQMDAQHITGLKIEDYLQQKLTSYMIPQVTIYFYFTFA